MKKEVECDSEVCDADSSMPVTLAGRGTGAVQNINGFSATELREIGPTLHVLNCV